MCIEVVPFLFESKGIHTMSAQPDEKPAMTLAEEYRQAAQMVDQGKAPEAVEKLTGLQERIARVALLSENETMDDLSTSSIPFLALEHELAKALTQLPMSGPPPDGMKDRLSNLQRACDLWHAFFQNLENMELVSKEEQAEYHALVELSTVDESESSSGPGMMMPPMSTSRDAKIARYNAKKQIQSDISKMNALLDRRNRLGLSDEDMDGHDKESLERSMALKSLELAKQDAMEEWGSTARGKKHMKSRITVVCRSIHLNKQSLVLSSKLLLSQWTVLIFIIHRTPHVGAYGETTISGSTTIRSLWTRRKNSRTRRRSTRSPTSQSTTPGDAHYAKCGHRTIDYAQRRNPIQSLSTRMESAYHVSGGIGREGSGGHHGA